MRTCSQQEIAIPVPDDLSDKAVNNFFDRLAKCPETKSDAISLDCSKLEDVTSAHIGILFQAQDYINKKGMKTYLRYVTPSLMHLLKALDLMKLFIIARQDRKVTWGGMKRPRFSTSDMNVISTSYWKI